MKKGFSYPGNKSPTKREFQQSPDVNPGTKQLFRGVSDHDWNLLRSGFGSGLAQIYVDEAARPEPGDVEFSSPALREEVKEVLEKILRST